MTNRTAAPNPQLSSGHARLPLRQVPYLSDGQIDITLGTTPITTPGFGRGWIEDYVPKPPLGTDDPTVAVEDEFPQVVAGDQEWIHDYLKEPFEVGSFANNTWLDRLATLAMLCAFAFLAYWLTLGRAVGDALVTWITAIGTAGTATLSFWRIRYRREPVSVHVRAVQSEFSEAKRTADAAASNLERLKANRKQRRNTYSAESSRLRSRQEGLQADQFKELSDIDFALQSRLKQINSRRRALTAEEGNEKRKLADTIGNRISKLARDIRGLDDQERQEINGVQSSIGISVKSLESQLQEAISEKNSVLKQALKEYQDQIINSHLHRYRIADASIPGIGPELKRRLAVAGYSTAGDIGTRYGDVPGIGAKKRDALYNWRRMLEGPIRAREAPTSLPQHKSASIEQRYEGRIRQLQQRLASERPRLTSEVERIQKRYLAQRTKLEQQKALEENNLKVQTAALEKKFNHTRSQLSTEEHQARWQSQRAAEESRAKFQVVASQLAEQAERLKHDYEADLVIISNELEAVGREMRQAAWLRYRLSRKLDAYAPLSFRGYAFRILGLS